MIESGSSDPMSASSRDNRPPSASTDATSSPGSTSPLSVEDLQQSARNLADQAKRRAESMLGDQKSVLAQHVNTLAEALRQTAAQLYGQNQPTVAKYTNEAVRGLDQLSNVLRTNDINSIIAQGGRFARRQPGVVVAGSIAVGFLLARFLKSTSASAQPDETETDVGDIYSGNSIRPESDYSSLDTPQMGG